MPLTIKSPSVYVVYKAANEIIKDGFPFVTTPILTDHVCLDVPVKSALQAIKVLYLRRVFVYYQGLRGHFVIDPDRARHFFGEKLTDTVNK